MPALAQRHIGQQHPFRFTPPIPPHHSRTPPSLKKTTKRNPSKNWSGGSTSCCSQPFLFNGVNLFWLIFFFQCLPTRGGGTKKGKPGFWGFRQRGENRWNANDEPPSALEDDQNLDTLQQSHNPLLQERSRHPIHAPPPSSLRVCVIAPLPSKPPTSLPLFLHSSIKSLIPFFARLLMTAEAQTSPGCFLLRLCDRGIIAARA